MKNLLLGSVALAVLVAAGPATAADMPVKAPIGAPPIVSIYNWNGFYVGGHAGWGFAHSDGTGNLLDPTNPVFIGEHGANSNSVSSDGILGGGQIGFNWMAWQNVVLGVEADLSFANLKSNTANTTVDGTSFHYQIVDRFGTVRGRIGYAFNNWLIYGTGGFAWAHAYATSTQGPCGRGDLTCTMPFSPVPLGTVNSNTFNLTGWTAGGGVEVGITSKWTARLEYLYMDYGSVTFTTPSFNRTHTNTTTTNIARLGVNYKFN